MNLLAILLDNWPEPVWQLFPWSIYIPTLTIALSWILIHWNKKLAVLALVIATLSAYQLINRLYADIHFRKESKARLEATLQETLEMKPENLAFFSITEARHRELIQAMRWELASFDSQIVQAIPPYDRRMIVAVWFAAIFPFIMITVFYFSAANPAKFPESMPSTRGEMT